MRLLSTSLLVGLIALPVSAQDYPGPREYIYHAQMESESRIVWSGNSMHDDSYVEIHDPEVRDAWATVTFYNTMVHNSTNDFDLTFDGQTVTFRMLFTVNNAGYEGLYILPPAGFIARPDYIEVEDHENNGNGVGKAHIYEWIGG